MLGFGDGWVLAAYLFCVGSTILCVVYGIVNWNRGADKEPTQIQEEVAWAETEKKIEEEV